MLDEDVVVTFLFAVYEIETVGFEVATFAFHADDDVVAHMLAVEGDGAEVESGSCLHDDFEVSEFLAVQILEAVKLHFSSFLDNKADVVMVRLEVVAVLRVKTEEFPIILVVEDEFVGGVSGKNLDVVRRC